MIKWKNVAFTCRRESQNDGATLNVNNSVKCIQSSFNSLFENIAVRSSNTISCVSKLL